MERPELDRRPIPRHRTLLGALIVFRGGQCTMSCLILNASDTGAFLRPADITLCPKRFVLKPRVGPSRDCEIVWRIGEDLGVRYLDANNMLSAGEIAAGAAPKRYEPAEAGSFAKARC